QTKALETELRLLSITDSLTGLHNQRHFYETLTRELTIIKSRSNAPPLSLLCIDLDCLKQVNDRLGHLEGDQVLRDVAAAIEAHVRSQDISFRYGGDEFMVLMPETCIKEAESIAQKICAEFDTLCKYSRCSAHRVASCASLSIGATQSNGSDDRETIVSRADLGMYRAKHAGGRAVVVVDQNESICVTTNVANAKANVS
ncbi:MAG: GGDEF domain-containing protein, partial [Pontibacterium sp.]